MDDTIAASEGLFRVRIFAVLRISLLSREIRADDSHVSPSVVDLNSICAPKYRGYGFTGEKAIGVIHVYRYLTSVGRAAYDEIGQGETWADCVSSRRSGRGSSKPLPKTMSGFPGFGNNKVTLISTNRCQSLSSMTRRTPTQNLNSPLSCCDP